MKSRLMIFFTIFFPIFFSIFIGCNTQGAIAGEGGDVVNNGGGASEQSIASTFLNYDFLLSPCRQGETCGLSPEEKDLLSKIILNLTQEKTNSLEFLNSQVMGNKLFITQQSIGSPIQINKDLLWKQISPGTRESFTVADALELLTNAFAEHHPQTAPNIRNSLGPKIGRYALEKRVTYLPYLQSPNFRLLTVKDPTFSLIILEDGLEAFFNIGSMITQQLPCPVSQFSVYSFQWGDLLLPGTQPIQSVLSGRIGWSCADSGHIGTRHRASVTIISLGMPVTGTVDEFWKKHGGSRLKMIDAIPKVVLSNIE